MSKVYCGCGSVTYIQGWTRICPTCNTRTRMSRVTRKHSAHYPDVPIDPKMKDKFTTVLGPEPPVIGDAIPSVELLIAEVTLHHAELNQCSNCLHQECKCEEEE